MEEFKFAYSFSDSRGTHYICGLEPHFYSDSGTGVKYYLKAEADAEIARLEAEVERLKALYNEWGFKDAPCPRHSKPPFLVENNCASCRVEVLEKALAAVLDLIEQSQGVYGLHLNGDGAPWETLRTGGQFEEWLNDFDAALSGGR